MTLLEAIDIRKSRRTYLPTAMSENQIAHLQNLIEQYNSESGLHIQLLTDATHAFDGFKKSYGMLKGVQSCLALIGNKADKYLEEKCGYYGELLVLEATSMGLGTCWVGGTYDKKSNAFALKEDEILACVIPIGNVPEETSREKFIHKLAVRKTKNIEELYTSDTLAPDWLIAGMQAVRKAPSAVNRQPVMFNYINGDVSASVSTKYAFAMIDFGIAKAHFVIACGGKFEWGIGGKFVLTN